MGKKDVCKGHFWMHRLIYIILPKYMYNAGMRPAAAMPGGWGNMDVVYGVFTSRALAHESSNVLYLSSNHPPAVLVGWVNRGALF